MKPKAKPKPKPAAHGLDGFGPGGVITLAMAIADIKQHAPKAMGDAYVPWST